MPETLTGHLVGSQAEWDRYRKYNAGPLAPLEEQETELEQLVEKRSRTLSRKEQGESVAQREERDHKRRMAQLDREEREANHYRRLAWFRHLRKVYRSRLDEVETALAELDPRATEGSTS